MYPRISVLINTKDRHSELSLLLQSLRTQTYQNFDIFIYDESQTPIDKCEFLVFLINHLKQENHYVIIENNPLRMGVCKARNDIVKIALERSKNHLFLRVDDDVIIEPDYIEKLLEGIMNGYDIMSGVTPSIKSPDFVRENKFVKPIINEVCFDKDGNIIKNGDDCGYCYIEEEIIPTHHFRSCALITREVHETIQYPTNLTPVGFREEEFFSMKAILNGFRIGVHTGAIARHLQSSSGGCRYPDYMEKVQTDELTFREWMKKKYKIHGDFLTKYVNSFKLVNRE